MSRLKATLNRIERALSRPRRNILISIVFVVIGITALLIGNSRSNRLVLDRAYRDGISAAVSLSTQTLNAVFGEDGLGGVEQPWLGLRVFDPVLNAWVAIDDFDKNDEIDGTLDERVVILVHGLDEPGGIWDQLAPALAEEGHQVVRFEYPNDQAIALSGRNFVESFDELTQRGVKRIDLVCHSMGGLVARDAITRDEFKTKGIAVERLVTIGTPHGGSPWARLQAVSELREQVQRWVESDDFDPKRLMGFARDGVGQAGKDLLPGSDFLVELDGRSLPEGVAVTCIVGRMIEEAGTQKTTAIVNKFFRDLVGDRDATLIGEELDKLSRELGDGVVPMSSAVLKGVDDVVIFEANHRSLVRSVELGEMIRRAAMLGEGDEPPAIAVVVDRLRRE
ncbi:MAG: alpha/beta fold hydrolase [Phycisphaerales bacterium]|nr:alpha/beta fold hydrolase [Phycisphaerales bacterium]